MEAKQNINPQAEFDLIRESKPGDRLLEDLSNLSLDTAIESNEDKLLSKASLEPPGTYIIERDGGFYLLDTTAVEPIPSAIKSHNLARSTSSIEVKEEKDRKGLPAKFPTARFLGKHGLLLGAVLGILLTLSATKIFSSQTTANKSQSEPEVVGDRALAQTVTVIEVITTEIDSTLNVSGTVAAFEQTPVMSQAAGLQITDVLVERGDSVTRGQVLARLNDRILQAERTEAQGAVSQARASLAELQAGSRTEEIAQAESRVANAQSAIAQTESDLELVRKRVQRNTSLQAEGAISRDALDEIINQERVAESALAGAKAQLNEAKQALAQAQAGSRPETIAQAEAELAQAKGRLEAVEAQLADTTITAPSAGIIASREARVGQITSASEMMFTIIQDGRLELQLQVPETLLGKIQSGQQVRISSNNRNINLTGKVRQIDPAINNSSRQATVRVDLPSNSNLKPGMFLQAQINTETNQGQAVPIEALLPQTGNKAIAFVVQPDNTVKAQDVVMGEILPEQRVEVVEGLKPGDRIVLKGAAYLKDGDKVAISKDPVSASE